MEKNMLSRDEMSVLAELGAVLREKGYPTEGEIIPVVSKGVIERRELEIAVCIENNAVVALSARYCGLKALPESLGQLAHLQVIDLTGNSASLPS